MEQAELRRKQEFERRKNNEREKKRLRILAHKKVVSRILAKSYLNKIKQNSYKHLCDVSFFTNSFKTYVME